MAPGGKDPPKGAKWFNESWASLPERNRRWRKSHHNKNLTAPRSSEREICENISSADRRLTDRQFVTGIQIRQLERVHALAAILKKASADFRNNGLRCFQLAESSAFRFLLAPFPATLPTRTQLNNDDRGGP